MSDLVELTVVWSGAHEAAAAMAAWRTAPPVVTLPRAPASTPRVPASTACRRPRQMRRQSAACRDDVWTCLKTPCTIVDLARSLGVHECVLRTLIYRALKSGVVDRAGCRENQHRRRGLQRYSPMFTRAEKFQNLTRWPGGQDDAQCDRVRVAEVAVLAFPLPPEAQ